MKYSTVRIGKPGDYTTGDVPTFSVKFLRWWYGLFGETVFVTGEWEE